MKGRGMAGRRKWIVGGAGLVVVLGAAAAIWWAATGPGEGQPEPAAGPEQPAHRSAAAPPDESPADQAPPGPTRPGRITFEQWLTRHFGHADFDPDTDLHGDGMTLREKFELSPAIDPKVPTKMDTENELKLQVYK